MPNPLAPDDQAAYDAAHQTPPAGPSGMTYDPNLGSFVGGGATDTSSGGQGGQGDAPVVEEAGGLPSGVSDSPNEGLPEPWTVYQIDGKYYIVWNAPVGGDRNVPVAWEISANDFFQMFSVTITSKLTRTLTMAEFEAAGGLDAGDFAEIQLGVDFWSDPLEGWLDALEENTIIAPWLADPEVAALAAAAYIEGTSLSQAQLAGTQWWQTHNASERAWLLLYSSDPATAQQTISDNRITTLDLLQAAGINNGGDIMVTVDGQQMSFAQWLADQVTMGHWSQVFLEEQIDYLADPRLRRNLSDEITSVLEGNLANVNGTRAYEMRVEELFRSWLGPMYGQPTPGQIRTWASRLRNDPDAETRLTEMLAGQRVALFPEYTDRSLTYEDIAGPWRSLGWQVWGEQLDEMDSFFTDLVRANDATEAGRMLRQEGLSRGVGKVMSDLVGAFQNSFGGPIVRPL